MDDLLMGALVFIAIMGFSFAFIIPAISGELKAEKRIGAMTQTKRNAKRAMLEKETSLRKGKVDDVLKDIEKAEEYRKNPPLKIRLAQAGLDWDNNKFIIFSVIAGITGFAFAFAFLGGNLLIAMGAGVVFGLGLPRWVLNFLKKRRIKQFTEELPNAIDIIVRGVKAGLPLNDCMAIVSREAKQPVAEEFGVIIELQQLGVPLGEAVQKMPERMPVSEANFFAIVVAIQSKSGGSLSEVLGNLSRVLRERKKLKNRIVALSQEAKSSAWIIGSLPILLSGFLQYASPQHMDMLFATKSGNFMLFCCAASMMLGAFVMYKMIDIKI